MRLYVTHTGRWAGTQADVRCLARADVTGWSARQVPTDKQGLIDFLNDRRPDRESEDAAPDDNAPPPAALSHAEASLASDVAFEALPLARQLHLAALALETARIAIGRAG